MRSYHFRLGALVLSAGAGLALLAGAPAEAKIVCNKGYQLVSGDEIATPYCQDEYLAEVAADYGIKTTGSRIRRDWSHKRDVCRLIGQDIRIQNACVSEQDPRGRRF